MEQNEMVALIRAGVPQSGGVWADLGAGTGNFTWALAELLGPNATIYALDRDARAVAAIERREQPTTGSTIIARQADVTRQLDLPPLDGIIMANLLHFMRNQETFLRTVMARVKPGGRLLLVEYEQKLPIPWVPFPVPFARWHALAQQLGLSEISRVATRRSPSSGREMYGAVGMVG